MQAANSQLDDGPKSAEVLGPVDVYWLRGFPSACKSGWRLEADLGASHGARHSERLATVVDSTSLSWTRRMVASEHAARARGLPSSDASRTSNPT
jgi:hypothetical protein